MDKKYYIFTVTLMYQVSPFSTVVGCLYQTGERYCTEKELQVEKDLVELALLRETSEKGYTHISTSSRHIISTLGRE